MNTRTILVVVGIIIVIILGLFLIPKTTGSTKLDGFASCIAESDATFYGAFWCPHCQNQKKLFGQSARLLPYVECSTPDGNGVVQICIDKKIESYPTWIFADGTKLVGEVELDQLAEKTGCMLPAGSGEVTESEPVQEVSSTGTTSEFASPVGTTTVN